MSGAEASLGELYRHEAGRITAWLMRRLGPSRLDVIEDAVQDAFEAALAQWPFAGAPGRPAAWLAVAARNKALDRLKRGARLDSVHPGDEQDARRLGFSHPDEVGDLDDALALMFVACHPALTSEEQTMLTLQTVCGFGAKEVARAYLSTPEAVTQRLVRAKRKIRDLQLAFEVPTGAALAERLPPLINALYLLFNGGYTAGEGEKLMVHELCAEALRLATLLTEHPATVNGETHALTALMCFQHARAPARAGRSGEPILLAEQDRSLWDAALLARGFGHLRRASADVVLTALHVEAGIASVHAAAPSFEHTDWGALTHLYDMLMELKPSPVVHLNAAIACAYLEGPAAGLARLEALAGAPRLADYVLYHAACGDLLLKLDRRRDAAAAFARALTCSVNDAERSHLLERLRSCGG